MSNSDDPKPFELDYLARDYDSLLLAMKQLIPTKLPEWKTSDSPADFGNVMLQLFAHMGDTLSYYQDRVARESFLSTSTSRYSAIQHLRLIGYDLATASPAAALLSISVPGTFVGVATVKRGDAFATKSQRGAPSVRFEYNGSTDLQVDFATIAAESGTGRKKFPSLVPVEEGRVVRAEVLGLSDGTPDQRFRLSRSGLILRTLGGAEARQDLELNVRLGAVTVPWRRQNTLAFSRADQADYRVQIDENDQATVCFGDGAFGAIPAVGASVIATYRYGGGALGNVAAGTIATIVDAPALSLLGARVSNPAAATGGAERESLEQAVRQAPRVYRSMQRAVTAEDYRALALAYPGVGKVKAEAVGANLVKLIVAPGGGGQVSDVLRAGLLAYFEDKRPICSLIEITNPDYVRIYTTAEIEVGAYYTRAAVEERARQAASALLAFDGVDFGRAIYLSKFYEALEAVDGIEFVNITEFRREFDEVDTVPPRGKLELTTNQIARKPDDPVTDTAYRGGLRLIVTGGT